MLVGNKNTFMSLYCADLMKIRKLHVIYPWVTLFITIAIPLLTYLYNTLPALQESSLALWLTSPFNITYEMQGSNGLLYNYFFVVAVYLLVELYSRNLADLEGRGSLLRNAFLLSLLSSYIISACVWMGTGYPSSGSSVMGFNILLFASFETYDSELINRMSEKRQGARRTLEIVSATIVVLLVIVSSLIFMYLNGNNFWYVHLTGGALFVPLYLLYLNRWIRPRFDAAVEGIEARLGMRLKGIVTRSGKQ